MAEDGSLCVLGAGNCNDIDLVELASTYASVDLVDLDLVAVRSGLERQQPEIRTATHNCDLSGLANLLEKPDVSLEECLTAADIVELRLGSFDVVCSACVLSQLFDGILRRFSRHPNVIDLIQVVRRRHFEIMLNLLRPGGCGLLVTDIVSSTMCPELTEISNRDLPPLLGRAIASRNFFTGTNPAVLHHDLTADTEFASRLTDVEVTTPWLWNHGLQVYAVYCIGFRRKPNSAQDNRES